MRTPRSTAKSTPYTDFGDRSSSPFSSPMPQTPSSDGASEFQDEKPDIVQSDEEIQVDELDDDEKPDIRGNKGKTSKAKTTPKKKSTAARAAGGAGGAGKGGAWTGEEDWRMFQLLHPKVAKPDWKAIAEQVGRDAKSCQNRYAVLGKRLEPMVKGISGL